ncbi:hypothetical protein [Sporolactobacillus pectinivorans]|uniref:hypothetical protein n=1 Tax=Sporolactobacillus pectinivorans TaxID=1591408 RepID=UPI000C261418|nr:hypothetical protein [Sporolactobacillus pectinivorans]
MKKFRGKKRYFRCLWRNANIDEYDLDFGHDGWFDFWHEHLDHDGRGDGHLRIRKEHIKAHLALYRSVLDKLKGFNKPYQSWIFVVDDDSAYDAVYIHSSNPYGDFPWKIKNLNWNCAVPDYLQELINQEEFIVGYCEDEEGSKSYIIQSKNSEYLL